MISSNFLDFLNCYDIKTKKDQKPKKGARAGSPSPTFKLKTLLISKIAVFFNDFVAKRHFFLSGNPLNSRRILLKTIVGIKFHVIKQHKQLKFLFTRLSFVQKLSKI